MTGRVGQHSVGKVSVDGSRFFDVVGVQDWFRAVWIQNAGDGQIKAKDENRLERNANQRSIPSPGTTGRAEPHEDKVEKRKGVVPDMRGVIKLGDHIMPVILTCETMLALCLRAEMP